MNGDESKIPLPHLILFIFIMYLLCNLFIPQNVRGGYRPDASHNPPDEIPPDSSFNLTISFEEKNITSVYLSWWNVNEELSVHKMHPAGAGNRTWYYHIPPQGEEGQIRYFFSIELNYSNVFYYGSEKQPITVPIREEINIFNNYGYLMFLGIVAVVSIILFEIFRRKVRNYMEDIADIDDSEDDRWGRT